MIKYFCLFGLLFLIGCSTGQTLRDANNSLVEIQRGISSLFPGGVASVSENKRTFVSKYFDPKTMDSKRTTTRKNRAKRERASVIATVLGDRRPYDIEIKVLVEEDLSAFIAKSNDNLSVGSFSTVGADEGLAKHFVNRLANYLAHTEQNKNLIDDFRPF